jgi:hypothetical protein
MVNALTFPLESNLNRNKNRSTLFVGGFSEIDAPSWICSEPHSALNQGKYGMKGYVFKNLIESRGIVK